MPSKIPTRAEHDLRIRRIWTICISLSLLFFLAMGGTVIGMASVGYDSKSIVNVLLIAVYIVVPLYGVGYMGPAFATSLVMGHRGIEIGEKTSETMDSFAADIKPILRDARDVIGEVKELVEQFKSQNPKAIVDFIEKLSKDGTVDRVAKSIETVAKKIGDVLEPKNRLPGASKEHLLSGSEDPKSSDSTL